MKYFKCQITVLAGLIIIPAVLIADSLPPEMRFRAQDPVRILQEIDWLNKRMILDEPIEPVILHFFLCGRGTDIYGVLKNLHQDDSGDHASIQTDRELVFVRISSITALSIRNFEDVSRYFVPQELSELKSAMISKQDIKRRMLSLGDVLLSKIDSRIEVDFKGEFPEKPEEQAMIRNFSEDVVWSIVASAQDETAKSVIKKIKKIRIYRSEQLKVEYSNGILQIGDSFVKGYSTRERRLWLQDEIEKYL